MAAQLNIKDPATIELARSLAKRTGRSVTATIRDSLEQADSANNDRISERAERFLASLRAIPFEMPPELVGKTSREIIKEVQEEDWQDQYGRDSWS